MAATATGRAILEAAAERRVGAPVYLRCAAEVAPGEDLAAAAAGAVELAIQALGPALNLYAAGGTDHLALTVRHLDGSVALLGIGRRAADAPAVPPSMLLVGDRGVVEGCPAPPLPSGAGPTAGAPAPDQVESGSQRELVAAITRSLRSGRPEAMASDG